MFQDLTSYCNSSDEINEAEESLADPMCIPINLDCEVVKTNNISYEVVEANNTCHEVVESRFYVYQCCCAGCKKHKEGMVARFPISLGPLALDENGFVDANMKLSCYRSYKFHVKKVWDHLKEHKIPESEWSLAFQQLQADLTNVLAPEN